MRLASAVALPVMTMEFVPVLGMAIVCTNWPFVWNSSRKNATLMLVNVVDPSPDRSTAKFPGVNGAAGSLTTSKKSIKQLQRILDMRFTNDSVLSLHRRLRTISGESGKPSQDYFVFNLSPVPQSYSAVAGRALDFSIHFLVRTNVDQDQNFRAGFRIFLFCKNNPAVVTGGTCVKSGQFPAQMMCFQTGIVEIFRHAPQGRFDLRLQRGIFPDQTAECPFKPGRRNKLAHGSLGFAQTGDEIFSRLAFEFAGAKGFDGVLCFRRRFLPPRFYAAPAQQAFKHFLFVNRQSFGFGQDSV
jgi:hypothetical protein